MVVSVKTWETMVELPRPVLCFRAVLDGEAVVVSLLVCLPNPIQPEAT